MLHFCLVVNYQKEKENNPIYSCNNNNKTKPKQNKTTIYVKHNKVRVSLYQAGALA